MSAPESGKGWLAPEDPARPVVAALYVAAAVSDLGLAALGLPSGLGTVASATHALFTKNTNEAAAECDRTLAGTARAREQLDMLRADVDELQRRVTMWLRAVHEAGRHPDRELRLALGRFAARSLVESLSAIDAFEIADALARMTALDLVALRAGGRGLMEIQEKAGAEFPGVDYERSGRLARRLQGFGLVGGGVVAPTPLGRELLRLIADPLPAM